jgi:hypothetical protein
MCLGCRSLCKFFLSLLDRMQRLLHWIHWEQFWWVDALFKSISDWNDTYIFVSMNSIDFIKSISLFFGSMEHIDDFSLFDFSVKWIEYDLYSNVRTMRLSCTRMTSRSPEFCYFTLRGRIRIATVMLDYSY